MQVSHGRLEGATQAIAFTSGGPSTSTAVGSEVFKIRLVSTQACFVSIGSGTGVYLPAGVPELFDITPGVASVVTVQAVSTSGNLYISGIV